MRSNKPKVLHKICGVPLINHVVSSLQDAGFLKPILVASPKAEAFHALLGDSVDFVVQETALGTGHALSRVEGAIGADTENVLVMNGDCPLVSSDSIRKLMEFHEDTKAQISLMTTEQMGPHGYGRIIRDSTGNISSIIEEPEASPHQLNIEEVNGGVYAFKVVSLWPLLTRLKPSSTGEIYLTDMVGCVYQTNGTTLAMPVSDPHDILGVNTRVDLAHAEAIMQKRIRTQVMNGGVTLIDPSTTYIDSGVRIGADTVIYPNTHLLGASTVGEGCEIGPNTVLKNSLVGPTCKVVSSVVDGASLELGVEVGPFSHLRPGSHIGERSYIGNYVEIKESVLGKDVKVGHFSYIGDADIGQKVNIGAGTVTANYDGHSKKRTTIGENAFIGSDTILVAPIHIGHDAATGAGSVVTKDVSAGETVVGVPAKPKPLRAPKRAKNS